MLSYLILSFIILSYLNFQPQIHCRGTLEKDEVSPDSRVRCIGYMPSFGPGDHDDDDDGEDGDNDDNVDG